MNTPTIRDNGINLFSIFDCLRLPDLLPAAEGGCGLQTFHDPTIQHTADSLSGFNGYMRELKPEWCKTREKNLWLCLLAAAKLSILERIVVGTYTPPDKQTEHYEVKQVQNLFHQIKKSHAPANSFNV